MSDVSRIEMFPLSGIPEVGPGDDLGALIVSTMDRAGETWKHADILVVTQKVVSKAEGRMLCLSDITPGPRALEIAASSGKDARKVQAILGESSEILRVARAGSEGLVIASARLGMRQCWHRCIERWTGPNASPVAG